MNWTKKLARFAPPGDDLRTALIAYMLALLTIPIFTAAGMRSSMTTLICASTSSGGRGWLSATPKEF